MSSSDSFRAPVSEHVPSPWSLDELESTDVFLPIHEYQQDPASPYLAASTARAAEATSAGDAVVEAAVEARVAQLRQQVEAEAFARGHAAGITEAEQRQHDQISRVLQALVDATQSVHAHEQRWLGNVEENLAASAVTIARHLIQRELTVEPSVITDLVARSLTQLPLEKQITVRLHPDDLAIVHAAIARDELVAAKSREIRWQADTHIVRGGCLVDGRERVLDGRIDTALERTYRALGQALA